MTEQQATLADYLRTIKELYDQQVRIATGDAPEALERNTTFIAYHLAQAEERLSREDLERLNQELAVYRAEKATELDRILDGDQ